jgi:hypothetical protein
MIQQMVMTRERILLLAGLIVIPALAFAQGNVKTEALEFTKTMELKISPSPTSSESDFDFLEGKWNVHNRKLKSRLSNSNVWEEFESTLHMRKTLNGMGNVENYYAMFGGKKFEGMAVRLFNPETKLWMVYWMDTGSMVMDKHPVTGSFENGVGKLYAKDSFNGKSVIVLYQWDARDKQQPKWSQAFSDDNGKTWEWNWEMTLTKMQL